MRGARAGYGRTIDRVATATTAIGIKSPRRRSRARACSTTNGANCRRRRRATAGCCSGSQTTPPRCTTSASIAHQVGQHATALDLINRSITLDPNQARYLQQPGRGAPRAWGVCPRRSRRCAGAVRMEPNDVDFVTNYGIALLQVGRLDEAEQTLRRATTLGPSRPEPWLHLSRVEQARGRADGGARRRPPARRRSARGTSTPRSTSRCYSATQRARTKPRRPAAHARLGPECRRRARHARRGPAVGQASIESIPCFRRALDLNAERSRRARRPGRCVDPPGRLDERWPASSRALQLAPHDHATRNAIGPRAAPRGRPGEARDAFRRRGAGAARRRPSTSTTSPPRWRRPASWTRRSRRLRRAVELDPSHAMARANLGKQLALAGLGGGSRRAHPPGHRDRRRPNRGSAATCCSNLHYLPDLPPEQLFQEHLDWAERHARPLASRIRPHENDRDPDRRLRVGYVSADFFAHAVADFIEPILAAHDRARFEVVCFSDVVRPDDVHRAAARLRRPLARRRAAERRRSSPTSSATNGSTSWSTSPATPRATACWSSREAGAGAGDVPRLPGHDRPADDGLADHRRRRRPAGATRVAHTEQLVSPAAHVPVLPPVPDSAGRRPAAGGRDGGQRHVRAASTTCRR